MEDAAVSSDHRLQVAADQQNDNTIICKNKNDEKDAQRKMIHKLFVYYGYGRDNDICMIVRIMDQMN